MSTYDIRRAQPEDWELIRSVRLRSLADAPDAFGTTLAEDAARSEDEWRSRAAAGDVAHFLAVASAGEGLGMAVGAPYTDYERTAGLFGMWVSPEARGAGVGRALVEAVVSWSRREAFSRIVLDVGDDNVAAVRLYESCGFVPTGKTGTLAPPRQHITEHERELVLT